eukprot:4627686-Pyramimonas_sp.AAC.1
MPTIAPCPSSQWPSWRPPPSWRSEAAAAAALQVERAIPPEATSGVSGKAQRAGPRPGEKC